MISFYYSFVGWLLICCSQTLQNGIGKAGGL